MPRPAALFLALAALLSAACGTLDPPPPGAGPPPGTVLRSPDGFAEWVVGEAPLVLAAPHGGLLRPEALPDRACAACVTANDQHTQDLTRRLAAAFADRYGCRPHVVVNHLHRIKLDANRDVAEAALGHAAAEAAWRAFQAYVDTARALAAGPAGWAFFVDVHGHAHPAARAELGYLLRADALQRSDAELTALRDASSLRALALRHPGRLPFAALVRGSRSLGALLDSLGYAAVPSPRLPAPEPGAPYFSGGYNTARHGSRGGGPTDAVQVELPFPGVRDTEANRARFAAALAEALGRFLEAHAGPLPAPCR